MRHTGWMIGAVLLSMGAGAAPVEAQRAGKEDRTVYTWSGLSGPG